MLLSRSVAAVLVIVALPGMRGQTRNASLDSRIQRLEDIEEIRRILTDYGRFLDARDFASYARLFAKDGEWVGGFGTVKGPAAIQAFMEKNIMISGNAMGYIIGVEIFDHLEKVMDRFEDVANRISGIVIEHI